MGRGKRTGWRSVEPARMSVAEDFLVQVVILCDKYFLDSDS